MGLETKPQPKKREFSKISPTSQRVTRTVPFPTHLAGRRAKETFLGKLNPMEKALREPGTNGSLNKKGYEKHLLFQSLKPAKRNSKERKTMQ